jgi:hypothetical protein
VMGCVPAHEPGCAVRVLPTTVVPETVGRVVLWGGPVAADAPVAATAATSTVASTDSTDHERRAFRVVICVSSTWNDLL